MVTLALALMVLIVVTQFFTNKATNALTTGNLKAVSTFDLNNRIQEIVNTSFELESKLKGARLYRWIKPGCNRSRIL
ncbi:hypothetical protein [Niabella hibiscisoli]|uniref:hypothetical protein n=1 Tax=Niabella hibiscisoli TaxID=1825928 RepID=UPI001F0E1EAB|nr:hypothetical protein [Niabella hibiscisoli]MCH5715314.1 hypothetical protein [Niabella hibiscisoli]